QLAEEILPGCRPQRRVHRVRVRLLAQIASLDVRGKCGGQSERAREQRAVAVGDREGSAALDREARGGAWIGGGGRGTRGPARGESGAAAGGVLGAAPLGGPTPRRGVKGGGRNGGAARPAASAGESDAFTPRTTSRSMPPASAAPSGSVTPMPAATARSKSTD